MAGVGSYLGSPWRLSVADLVSLVSSVFLMFWSKDENKRKKDSPEIEGLDILWNQNVVVFEAELLRRLS